MIGNYLFSSHPFHESFVVPDDPYRFLTDVRRVPATGPSDNLRRGARSREVNIPIYVEGRDETIVHSPAVQHPIDLTGDNFNNNGVHNHSRKRRQHQSSSRHSASNGKTSNSGRVSHIALSPNVESLRSLSSVERTREAPELSDELIDLCIYEDLLNSDCSETHIDQGSTAVSKSISKDANLECLITDVTTKSTGQASAKSITPTPSYQVYKSLKSVLSKDGRLIDYIKGDGNCFFRALSKDIYGSEDFHHEVRQAVVDLIEEYPKEFEQFLDSDKPISEHIRDMRRDATWATSAEIYAAATLLQRDVYVLSPAHTGDSYHWMKFRPRFIYTRDTSYHPCFITLCHTHGNHYDRITPHSGNCNCDYDPPALSGVQAYVDLTK